MLTIEFALLATAVLLLISVFASKASSRTGIPALLLFLLIGMFAGPEGFVRLPLNDPALAQSIGVIALALILFSGGLDTDWRLIRPIFRSGLALANIGVALSALVFGGAAMLFLGFTPLEGLLLGVVVSSTDAAAVFSVMRARDVNLKGNLEPLVEFESGSNDPIAVFLTIGITSLLINPNAQIAALVPSFLLQMVLGALVGFGLGRSMAFVINRVRLKQEGLYPVLTLALVLLTYGLTATIGGNGFLAVYIAGIVLNSYNFVHKRSLMRFHDGLAWLMQIAMFIVLGIQIYPSALPPLIGSGLLMSLVLIFVARPLSVFGALALSAFTVREKLMVSWVGLRGAVPIVLATFPLIAGVPQATLIFDLVFFIVLTSVLIQGTTIPTVARWLRLQTAKQTEFHYPHEFAPDLSTHSQLMELRISKRSAAHGQSIIDLKLPSGVLVVSITRDGTSIVPNGGTVLELDDRMLVLANRECMPDVREAVLAPRPEVA